MSRPRVLAIVFLSLTVVSGVALVGQQDRPASDRDRFIGAWRLVSLEAPGPGRHHAHVRRDGPVHVHARGPPGRPGDAAIAGRASPGGAAAVRARRVRGHVRPVRGRRGRAHLHATTSRAAWSARWWARRCRAPTRSPATDSSSRPRTRGALARGVGALLKARSAAAYAALWTID